MAPQPLNRLHGLLNDALAETPPGRSIWVALSGGLDSCLLLTLAAAVSEQAGRDLRAIHINHGLQAAASTFEAHARLLCERLGIPLAVANVAVDAQGEGIEGAARNARYEAFFATIPTGDTLWLAQHQDDQAETFLLAALRGSGVRGLAGMPYRRDAQGITLVRPWLTAQRAALEQAARSLGLTWCEDPTNSDISLDRNRLRHRVLPALRERWPAVDAALANSAAHASEAHAVLSEYVQAELSGLMAGEGQVDASELSKRSRPRQRLLIRALCQQQGLPTPPQKRLESLLDQLLASADAQVCVEWQGVQARLWRQRLYLMAPLEPLPAWEVSWDGQTPLETPLGPLGWQVALSSPLSQRSSQPLKVTWRQGGEVIELPTRGRRDLKRLLQESNVPPWERGRLVVVMQAEACVGVFQPPDKLLWQAAGVWFRPEAVLV
ncbi:MAG: cell cycle protein [Halomonas sp. 54_146]|nr:MULTISPECIES: tRNA lysidine(34) synthetase TilS [unclassified Halomonas]KUJ88757.1 MAG: cell cycle protein [Halomonas sp. 54_146]HAA44593.1 tRNA lysidine(34) synthetase TilS [Halomonas sp.]